MAMRPTPRPTPTPTPIATPLFELLRELEAGDDSDDGCTLDVLAGTELLLLLILLLRLLGKDEASLDCDEANPVALAPAVFVKGSLMIVMVSGGAFANSTSLPPAHEQPVSQQKSELEVLLQEYTGLPEATLDRLLAWLQHTLYWISCGVHCVCA